MAPSHVVFSTDGELQPKYSAVQQATPAASPTPSTSGSKRASPPSPRSTTASLPRAKKPKVANFSPSDEEDNAENGPALTGPRFGKDAGANGINGHAHANSGVRDSTPKGKFKLGKEDKERLSAEAHRLSKGRKELPIWEGKDAIIKAVEENDTVVILGETGSGKTTQVPQFILNSNISTERPRLCVTQPRRVAATSLATRVAAEAGCTLGGKVGYTVRFDDKSTPKTRLKYMTDGALLAEMLGDRDLERYEVVVLDEAHERSLRTDMLMGFLKQVQHRRAAKVKMWLAESKGKGKEGATEGGPTPLKVVIMSATIDAKRFSEFFNDAPVLYIKGRQHKVKVLYTAEPQADYIDAALKTIFEIHTKRPPGDILVFLPGQEDIENLANSINLYLPDLLKSFANKGTIAVCPLYAKLAPAEQAKAFHPTPPNTRKVILSTNVAETSVTIPGVSFVIDTGLAKEKEYHATVGVESLITENISQSSAMQRMGRAGREKAGVCFRLYTEAAFMKLERTTKPEIQRVSLTFAILHLLAAGQDDVWSFDFMDKPAKDSIVAALLALHGLEATDKLGRITALGRQMASLPLEPMYSRVLLASFESGCPRDIIDLVSLIGARDALLINTMSSREAANAARKKFVHRAGDHMMLLNLLRAYEDVEKGEQRQWCRDNYVNGRAMALVLDSRKQLRERCERMKLDWEPTAGEETDTVLSTLVEGLWANTALLQPDGSYRHSLNRQIIAIHPGSIVHNKKAPAIIYDELVMTSKAYARGVSSIQLSWIRSRAPSVFNARTGAQNGIGKPLR